MTRREHELDELLARMRADEPAPREPDDEAEREERMAAHIDACVAARAQPRHAWQPRRIGILLLAACLPLALYVALRARGGDSVAGIAPEPRADDATTQAGSSAVGAATPRADEPTPPHATKETRAAAAARLPPSARASSSSPLQGEARSPVLAAPPPAPPEPAGATLSGSTLSEENRLFQRATQAERMGDDESALDALDRLTRDFPRSPLAQNAMVRKFHLLARTDRKAQAAAAARDYLRAYPLGFAQREAQDVANGAPDGRTPSQPDRE